MLAMPADHVVKDIDAFQAALERGYKLAFDGYLVIFGVQPTMPATEYGYIRKGESISEMQGDRQNGSSRNQSSDELDTGPWKVVDFVEKPNQGTAEAYLRSGYYLWNSGMFMMKTSVWLSELGRLHSEIMNACRAAHAGARREGDFTRIDVKEFETCPSESIDRAVIEKAVHLVQQPSEVMRYRSFNQRAIGCAVVPLDGGWSDLGGWKAYLEEVRQNQDSQGNFIKGNVWSQSTKNSLLLADQRSITAIGLEDIVVVENSDMVLVARRQHIDNFVGPTTRPQAERNEKNGHPKVQRPWGGYEILDRGDGFQVKRLFVKPGAGTSLQMHHHRSEHWVVVVGTATVSVRDHTWELMERESTNVPKGVIHRLENASDQPLEVIEIQLGDYLGEDDIVRFHDFYGRDTQFAAPC